MKMKKIAQLSKLLLLILSVSLITSCRSVETAQPENTDTNTIETSSTETESAGNKITKSDEGFL